MSTGAHAKRVEACYEFFDRLFPACGLVDFTEGMYRGDPTTPYEETQRAQIDHLLDQAGCAGNARLLDIGCGNGTLLERAAKRGASPLGITLSPAQLARCRARGLEARLLDYRDLDAAYENRFDAVVANGSVEHFARPRDAATGRADTIYRRFFEICHRVIDPASSSGRLVTTVIHMNAPLQPAALERNPLTLGWRSHAFHGAWLNRGLGGSYPSFGQLQRCAAGMFRLVDEEDGTQDYLWTSEEWLRRVKACLMRPDTGPPLWASLAGFCARHPFQGSALLLGLLVFESWNAQFRGASPPTRLLRQTWQRV